MSANSIPLVSLVYDLKCAFEAMELPIHPSAQCLCAEWFSQAMLAAADNDGGKVKQLLDRINHKIDLELVWEAEAAAITLGRRAAS